jgi:hypothetical protein
MDLALLIIAAKAFLGKDKDPCSSLKAGTPAWLACKESQR